MFNLLGRRPHHYHVTTSGALYIPEVKVRNESEAMIESDKMVGLVIEHTGASVEKDTVNQIFFNDGTVVRYAKCYMQSCMPLEE